MTEGVFWNEFVNQSWVGCFVVKPCSRLVHHTILQRVRHCCHHYDHYQHQNHHWWSWSSWTLTRRQHPVICLPSVKTGWRDKISTPEPLCWWRRRWWDNDDDDTDNGDQDVDDGWFLPSDHRQEPHNGRRLPRSGIYVSIIFCWFKRLGCVWVFLPLSCSPS